MAAVHDVRVHATSIANFEFIMLIFAHQCRVVLGPRHRFNLPVSKWMHGLVVDYSIYSSISPLLITLRIASFTKSQARGRKGNSLIVIDQDMG